MARRCAKCKVEFASASDSGWCRKCEVSYEMMEIIVDEYVTTGAEPEDWLELMMGELDFLYKRNATLFAYLNTAVEVMFEFVLGGVSRIETSNVGELNHTALSGGEIIDVLERALLVKREDGRLLSGVLTEKLHDLRLEALPVRSDEFQAAVTQAIGVIAVSLTKALFELYGVGEGNRRFPRSAMAVLHLLAALMIEAEDNNRPIDPNIALSKFYSLTTNMLTPRQRRYAVYLFVSLVDGKARLLKDYDAGRSIMILDDVVINFLERIRERRRERGRLRGAG